MLNPAEIDPLSLPSVPLEDRRDLPTDPCIYFAIDGQGVVQYVGKAKNLRNRWQGHHRRRQLEAMGNVRIAYVNVDPGLLSAVESAMIERIRPYINCVEAPAARNEGIRKRSIASMDAQAMSALTGGFKVTRTKEWTVENLPLKLSNAAKASPKGVTQICREANISRGFWSQLTNSHRPSISLKTLKALCKALGISLESLGLNPE